MLSATAHDVLYYMSPIYCQDIIDSVSNQLNRLYLKFIKRNPGYDGKISLYGHSLGSVLSYDILCHQENLYSPFPMECMYRERERTKEPSSVRDYSSSGHQRSEAPPLRNALSLGEYQRNGAPSSILGDSLSGCNPISDLGIQDSEKPDNPDIVEELLEGSPNPLGPPQLSESDESTTMDIVYQLEDDASSSDEHVDKPSFDLDYMEDRNKDTINDSNNLKNKTEHCDVHKSEDMTENEKDKTIKSLTEEIKFLKSKIKECEAKSAPKAPHIDSEEGMDAVAQFEADTVARRDRDTLKSYTPQIRYTKLEFKVDTFFAVGSPLGVFLPLRNVRIGIGKGKEYWEEENINEEMPACRQMFNIFHPFDPVAYRIEPLVCKEFIHKRPVIVPYHRGGKRLYVGFQEFKEGLASHSTAMMDQLSTVRTKVLTICEERGKDVRDEEPEIIEEEEERSYGALMMEILTGSEDGRVDHVLQDKTFRHPYLSAIASHTNYWRDYDTALFILKHLYRDIPEAPISSTEQLEGLNSKDEASFKGWSDPREINDEELPLTFADSVSIKSFSYRAKKAMKS